MRTGERIRIHRPRVRRERPWHEVLPPDSRDPDVVRAKALARAGDRAGRRTARQSHFPGLPRRRADSTPPGGSPGEGPTSMHPYVMQEIARQREGNLRRAARQYGPAGLRSHRPATATGTAHFGGKTMRSKPMILVALLLAAFLVNLDTTLVNVALPALVRELHATTTQLQWVVDSYNLVFAALLLTFGSLSDRFGRKGMLLAGLTVVGAASLAGGFTTDPAQLIAARSVMGLGAAMTFPATLSLLSNVFTERRERARAIGLWGAIAGVAIAMGPIVGGWLLEHFSWASIFIAMAPVAAAAVILAALIVPASKDPDAAAPDVPGLVLSSATMALLVFTIIEAPAYGWAGARSLAGFAGSAVLLALFIVRERQAAQPMLDVRLFRNPRFSAASGAVTVSFFTLFGFIFLITQYFQFVRGYGPLSTGVHLLPVAL